MSAAPTQTTTTQHAATRAETAPVEPARTEAPQDPPTTGGRLRDTALRQPHAVANPRRIRVR